MKTPPTAPSPTKNPRLTRARMAAGVLPALLALGGASVTHAQTDDAAPEHALRWLSTAPQATVLAKIAELVPAKSAEPFEQLQVEFLQPRTERATAPAGVVEIFRLRMGKKSPELTYKVRVAAGAQAPQAARAGAAVLEPLIAAKLAKKQSSKQETDVTWLGADRQQSSQSTSFEVKLAPTDIGAALQLLGLQRPKCASTVQRTKFTDSANRPMTLEVWRVAGQAATLYELSIRSDQPRPDMGQLAVKFQRAGYSPEAGSKTAFASQCR